MAPALAPGASPDAAAAPPLARGGLIAPPLVAPGNGVIAAAGRRLLEKWEQWAELY